MAGCSKLNYMGVVVAMAVVLLLQLAGAQPVPSKQRLEAGGCATSDEYVYPYWSLCSVPAYLLQEYHYVSTAAGLGGLEPEWDESNATYYVRFTGDSSDSGATYVAASLLSSAETPILVNATIYLYNSATQRGLVWRQEGSDEYFLIEDDVSDLTEAAPFRLQQAEDIALPCPLIYPPAQCHAYYVVSDPSSSYTAAGLLAYEEDGTTYVKAAPAGSVGDLPILLRRSTATSIFSTGAATTN